MYDGIIKHKKIIPKYENLMVALCVCTRHIPPYTMLYGHMTVYHGICRDIRVSGIQMDAVTGSQLSGLASRRRGPAVAAAAAGQPEPACQAASEPRMTSAF